MPLYMHSALLIIRKMGVDAFNYRGKSAIWHLSCLLLMRTRVQAPDQRREAEPNAKGNAQAPLRSP